MTIIGGHNLPNIGYADDTILLADRKYFASISTHIRKEKRKETINCYKYYLELYIL